MSRNFFVEGLNISEGSAVITGDAVNHIKNVLRLSAGDEITLFNRDDPEGKYAYRAEITDITRDEVRCRVLFVKEADIRLPYSVTLLQCLPKSGKMELVIQKCTELGISRVIPVLSDRSVSRPDGKKALSRAERWRTVAEEAAMQARRSDIPEVTEIQSFREALRLAEDADVKIIPYELSKGFKRTREIIDGVRPGQSVAMIIGPEGGFTPEEVQAANDAGFESISLGRRILRTETAALVVMSWLMFRGEEDGENTPHHQIDT